MGGTRTPFGRVGWGGVEAFREGFRELVWRDGAAIEPSPADLAPEPEEHVGDGLVFDTFGDGGETEAVVEADNSGCDLPALARVVHRADEAGIDFELIEGEGLGVTEVR